MTQWEYMMFRWPQPNDEDLYWDTVQKWKRELDGLGRKEWEAVGMVPSAYADSDNVLLMKRPITPPKEDVS